MSDTLIWENQKKINGELCRVDWRLISALREASAALNKLGADVTQLNALVNEADSISDKVAIPNPPGCLPTNRKS
jgi:hypothetical protein